ncbi:MAG: protein kinase [Polyangiaceae bacterium]|nr:protein kinase [Polyangiaceae bacterium]
MAPVDPYGLVGQVLDGQFRVDAAVGEGGFSIVYRGHHLGLDEPVAIKCLKLQGQLGSALVEAFVRRFRDESRIHYKLSQESLHVARTIAAGTAMSPVTQGLVPYMVLEWLDGFTLSEQLRARRERGERGRSLAEIVRLLDPVAEAMASAHALGVVHRDLNPSNIFLASQPTGGFRPKVMDFGVAKIVSDHALALGPRAATMGQIRMFTPAYGAPEQFDHTLGEVGPAADVYAFALLVVELLRDQPAITGEHLGEFLEKATDEARRPTPRALGVAVGDRVEALFADALSTHPARRPQDMGALWGALKHAMQEDDASRPASPSAPPQGPRTFKGTLIIGGPQPQAQRSSRPPGLGSTMPMMASPVAPSTPPLPRDPFVDAYGSTAGSGEARDGASPLAATAGSHVFVPSSPPPPMFEQGTTSAARARAPVPAVAKRGGGAPIAIILVCVAVAIVAAALVAWKLLSSRSTPGAPPVAARLSSGTPRA